MKTGNSKVAVDSPVIIVTVSRYRSFVSRRHGRKIVSVLASGLTQLGIWVLVAIIALVQAAPALAMSSAMSGFDLSTVLNARMISTSACSFRSAMRCITCSSLSSR
jgi:hypothetical protein